MAQKTPVKRTKLASRVEALPSSLEELQADGMDGRYWKGAETSRRAMRKKRRALVVMEPDSPLARGEADREEEEDQEEEGEEEEDPESEMAGEEEEDERQREAEAIVEGMASVGVGQFWRSLVSDASVSHSKCWRQFTLAHALRDLACDWVTFRMLVEERKAYDDVTTLRCALFFAEKWRGIDVDVLQLLQPRFVPSFSIPRPLLDCVDFAAELPQLSEGNSQEIWLELVRVHVRYALLVHEWLFTDNPTAPNVSAVVAVYLAKYARDDSFLCKPVARQLSLTGFCLLLQCLIANERDIALINLPFVERLKSGKDAVDEATLKLLGRTFECGAGVLPRSFRAIALESLASLAPLLRANHSLYVELCFTARTYVRFSDPEMLRSLFEKLLLRAPHEPLHAYVAYCGLTESCPLYFEAMGKLIQLGESYGELQPLVGDWSDFGEHSTAEHLDLLLRQLTSATLLIAKLCQLFGAKVFLWAKAEPLTRMASLGLARPLPKFVAAWKSAWVEPVMGTFVSLSRLDAKDDYLRNTVVELFVKSLTMRECWKSLIVQCANMTLESLATIANRFFCSVPEAAKVEQWFAAELWLLSVIGKAKRALPLECVDSVLHLIRNASVAFGVRSVHGVKIRLKLAAVLDSLFDSEAARIAVRNELRKEAGWSQHAGCECDVKMFDMFPPLALTGDTARDKDYKWLSLTLRKILT